MLVRRDKVIMDFFALQSVTGKPVYRVSNSEYDRSVPKTIRKGLKVDPEMIKSVTIDFDLSGKVIPDYVYHQAGVPLISEKLREIMEAELVEESHFLQIEKIDTNINEISQIYLLNVLESIDCLDGENSEIKLYEGTSVIEKAEKIKFKEELIYRRNIFRVNRMPKDYFISGKLAGVINSKKLKGTRLIPLEEYVFGF